MFILGLVVGLHVAILTFAIGFNLGVDRQGDLKKFRAEKLNRLANILE